MNKYIDRIEHTFDGNLQVEENVSFYRRKKEENSKKNDRAREKQFNVDFLWYLSPLPFWNELIEYIYTHTNDEDRQIIWNTIYLNRRENLLNSDVLVNMS